MAMMISHRTPPIFHICEVMSIADWEQICKVVVCMATVVSLAPLAPVEVFTLPHIVQLDSTGLQVIFQSSPGLQVPFFLVGAQPNYGTNFTWNPPELQVRVQVNQLESVDSRCQIHSNMYA